MLNNYEIEKMLTTNKVYLTYSTITNNNFFQFLKNNYDIICRDNVSLLIYTALLEKLRSSSRIPFINNVEKREKFIRVINSLIDRGILKTFGLLSDVNENNGVVLDILKDTQFDKAAVICNDSTFSADLIKLNRLKSVSEKPRITVYRLNRGGEVGFYNSNYDNVFLKEEILW